MPSFWLLNSSQQMQSPFHKEFPVINPIDTYLPLQTDNSNHSSKEKPARKSSVPTQSDVVLISEEAQQKLKASAHNIRVIQDSYKGKKQEQERGSSWNLSTGLKEGTFTLKNGNKQTVSIDGDSLEIEEFKDGKLVKTVTGSITDKGASLTTEYYDSSGRVRQSIQTEIAEGKGKDSWSVASMSRSVKWFDGDRLTGEMQDSMLLNSWNNVDDERFWASRVNNILSKGTGEVSSDATEMRKELTREQHISSYYANISEYGENGKLARNIVLEQEGRYDHQTNRFAEKIDGMERWSTRELSHNTKMLMEIKDYDSDGSIVRDARFTDTQQDAAGSPEGRQEQTVDVSWYSGGELVKRSHGSMSVEKTEAEGLPNRPGFLESLGVTERQYVSGEPKSAMELMNVNLMGNSGETDFFLNGTESHLADGDYSTAEGVGRYGGLNQPYSMSWTDELYKNGDLVVRRTDTEEARESSFYQQERGMLFRKGGALTENDSPKVLRKSSHENEVFEDGRLTAHQRAESSESVNVNMHGPDKLETSASVTQGVGMDETTTAMKVQAGLETLDIDANAAAKGLANEMEQTLGALYETIRDMESEDVDAATAYRVRLNYAPMSD